MAIRGGVAQFALAGRKIGGRRTSAASTGILMLIGSGTVRKGKQP
jgi:hypothetical protein